MFRIDLLSIIRGLDTVFTAIGICHTIYVDCLLADTYQFLWIQLKDSWCWTISLSEAHRVVYQNKVCELVHLVGFYYMNVSRCTVLWMLNTRRTSYIENRATHPSVCDMNNINDVTNVDKKNQLDVTFCILYFSSNISSTCFEQPCAHHQELTTVWCYSLVLVCAVAAGRWSRPFGR